MDQIINLTSENYQFVIDHWLGISRQNITRFPGQLANERSRIWKTFNTQPPNPTTASKKDSIDR
jgi:hypothetical protein